MSACVRACVACVSERACVRVCVRACVRACVRVRAHLHDGSAMHTCLHALTHARSCTFTWTDSSSTTSQAFTEDSIKFLADIFQILPPPPPQTPLPLPTPGPDEPQSHSHPRMRLGAAAAPTSRGTSSSDPASPEECRQTFKARMARWALRWLQRSDVAVCKGVFAVWRDAVARGKRAVEDAQRWIEVEQQFREDALDRHKKLKAYFALAHLMALEKMLAQSSSRRAVISLRRCLEGWKTISWVRWRHHKVASIMSTRLGRGSGTGVAEGFASWRIYTKKQVRFRAKMGRIILRLRNVSLCHAFETWRERMHQCRRQAGILAKVLSRWKLMTCARAFDSWHRQARLQKRLRRAAKSVVCRMRCGSCASAFTSWAATAGTAKRKRQQRKAASLILMRWNRRALSVPFVTWLDTVCDNQTVEAKCRRAAKRWLFIRLARAVEKWAEWVEENKRIGYLSAKVVIRYKRKVNVICECDPRIATIITARIRRLQ